MNGLEVQLDNATSENLKLKSSTFDLDFKINHYSIQVEQTQKRIKFYQEKQTKLLRDLEQASALQDKELRRLASDLDFNKKDLDKMKREALIKQDELRRLEASNQKV